MSVIGNIFKAVGTVGLGAVAGTAKIIAMAAEKQGFIPETEDKITRKCVNTIKKMWGREVDEQPETIYDRIYHEEVFVNNAMIMLENNRTRRDIAAAGNDQETVDELNETIRYQKEEILEHKEKAIELTKEADPDADRYELDEQLRELKESLDNPDDPY